MIRKSLLILFVLVLRTFGLTAQTASTICMDEVKRAFGSIDHQALLKSEKISKIDFTMSYIVRSTAEATLKEQKETVIYTRNQAHRTGSDTEVYTDATEAFNFRPGQFAIFRTQPSLDKAGVVPKLDMGIFNMVVVKNCDYIPWTGVGYTEADTTMTEELRKAAKEAHITVSPEGQKKYQISSFDLIYNPHTGTLRKLHIEFTEKSLFQFADYTFTFIHNDYKPETPLKSVKDYFLDGEGNLLPVYSTCKLDDYR